MYLSPEVSTQLGTHNFAPNDLEIDHCNLKLAIAVCTIVEHTQQLLSDHMHCLTVDNVPTTVRT